MSDLTISFTVAARGEGLDEPSDWALFVGIFALYLAIGFGLEYRAKRRRGAAQPARAAARGLFAERNGIAPKQHFASRMVMLVGALAAGATAYVTRGAPTAVQIVTVGVVAVLGIFAWAYFDHRTEPRDES
ncbi:hypothetical protein OKJ48_11770 [Streptomyces kunmingensis]|uniref:DUF2178 domain-containing protein n=1 Tax=Streptomyces kunmingensis TaxID=68225 RepID=A0ABU6C878_9ACTN|nr:hypothetical protein [Streptomyces kunmingensis]MEB3960918.1 hypothetical protein [Streptomyces kunmingensis]